VYAKITEQNSLLIFIYHFYFATFF